MPVDRAARFVQILSASLLIRYSTRTFFGFCCVGCATESTKVGTPSLPDSPAADGSVHSEASVADAAAEGPGAKQLPERSDTVCDGGTEVRLLAFWSGGRGAFPPFLLPFGNHFTFVDGQCRFFTGGYYGSGYRTGTLTHEQVAGLARDTGWVHLPSIDGLKGARCGDSPTAVLADPVHRAEWACIAGEYLPGTDLPGTDLGAPYAELKSLGNRSRTRCASRPCWRSLTLTRAAGR